MTRRNAVRSPPLPTNAAAVWATSSSYAASSAGERSPELEADDCETQREGLDDDLDDAPELFENEQPESPFAPRRAASDTRARARFDDIFEPPVVRCRSPARTARLRE
jgi:hypothetical protein